MTGIGDFNISNFDRGLEDFLAQQHSEPEIVERCALCEAEEEAKAKEASNEGLTSTMAKANAAGAQTLNTAGVLEKKRIELESLKAYPELQGYCNHELDVFFKYLGALAEFEAEWSKKLADLLERAAINNVKAEELEKTLAAFKMEKNLLKNSVDEKLRLKFPHSATSEEARLFNSDLQQVLEEILEILKEGKNLGDHPLIGRILQIDKSELHTLTDEIASLTDQVFTMISMKYFYNNKGGPINCTILSALIDKRFPECAGTYSLRPYGAEPGSAKLIGASKFTCKFPPTAPPAPFPKMVPM